MIRLFVAALLAMGPASPGEAFSLFKGKKQEKVEEPSRRERSQLPGMPEPGAPDPSEPPRMAQEAEAEKKEGAALPVTDESLEAPPPEAGVPAAPTPPAGEGSAEGQEQPSADGSLPTEVVIRGQGSGKRVDKPVLNLEVDPFASIRESLKPDQQLLLAESPLTVVWRRTHPEFLRSPRVVQPWRSVFSERPGIVFRPRDQLQEVLQRRLDDKEAKRYQWSLTVADEEGKVFQHYEGSSEPPEELLWSGQSDQGEWMRAGRAYSPVYMFTDPGGSPYTRVGKPLRFMGIVHQERDGLHLSMDSAILFGRNKASQTLEKEGEDLMRAAADLIKRNYSGIPIRVEVYAVSTPLAQPQSAAIQQYLATELMLETKNIITDHFQEPFSDQRVEIVLLNR